MALPVISKSYVWQKYHARQPLHDPFGLQVRGQLIRAGLGRQHSPRLAFDCDPLARALEKGPPQLWLIAGPRLHTTTVPMPASERPAAPVRSKANGSSNPLLALHALPVVDYPVTAVADSRWRSEGGRPTQAKSPICSLSAWLTWRGMGLPSSSRRSSRRGPASAWSRVGGRGRMRPRACARGSRRAGPLPSSGVKGGTENRSRRIPRAGTAERARAGFSSRHPLRVLASSTFSVLRWR